MPNALIISAPIPTSLPAGTQPARSTILTRASTAAADRRGHLCPSDDRDATPEDNAATFLLTNIVPQAPRHNREVWKSVEEYERQLMSNGSDVYIIAGASGLGGTGKTAMLLRWPTEN